MPRRSARLRGQTAVMSTPRYSPRAEPEPNQGLSDDEMEDYSQAYYQKVNPASQSEDGFDVNVRQFGEKVPRSRRLQAIHVAKSLHSYRAKVVKHNRRSGTAGFDPAKLGGGKFSFDNKATQNSDAHAQFASTALRERSLPHLRNQGLERKAF